MRTLIGMKKGLCIIQWGLCLALVLTACQPKAPLTGGTPAVTKPVPTATEDTRTPTATKVPTISADETRLNGVKITLLHPWSGETAKALDLMVEEFNQSNEWGITVSINEPGSTSLAIQELEQNDADASAIDLAVLPSWQFFRQDQLSGNMVDLNPYVQAKAVGFNDEQIEDYFPVFWSENLYNGKLYGVPAQQTASLLFYNATWAAELGYDQPPETLVDFKAQTCAANKTFRANGDRSNDGLGGWLISTDAGTMFSWLASFNAMDPSLPIDSFNTNSTQSAFQFLFDLQKDACAWSSRMPEPYDYFATRQTLVYSGSLQDIWPQTAAFERNGNEDEWRAIPYPSEGEQKLLTEGLSWGIIETDANRQLAAWLFIRWMAEPENQLRLLQTSGTLPLGSQALELAKPFLNYPQWQAAVSMLPTAVTLPADQKTGIQRMVLADAGSFLFRSEFTTDKIPNLLAQLDATIQELAERQP